MIVEWLIAAGKAFAAIAPVELPDKTFVATLILVTRFPPLAVWLGVVSAFAVHTTIAVLAGGLVGLLPDLPVRLAAAALFLVGAVVMLRAARAAGEDEHEHDYTERLGEEPRTGLRAFGASFLLLFLAEWADLSQLLTAALVASGEPATAVLAGALAALAAISGAAVLLGKWILRHIRLTVVRYVAAAVCAGIAGIILVSTLT